MSAVRIEVNRGNITEAALVAAEAPTPGDGEVLVEIERFSLTTNNITYAAAGEQLGYWRFFPIEDEAAGIAPVWGFARVTQSNCDGIEVGERLYGFWPMASHCVLKPGPVSDRWLTDAAEHRQKLPPVYNDYNRLPANGDGNADDLRALLQPLLVTSWLLYDFLEDNGWFGAEQIIIGSASSKTGLGLAKYLAEARPDAPKIVGLTSAGNVDFVERLGAYDQAVRYEAIEAAVEQRPSVYVDMAGNADVRSRLHHHLADHMKHSAAVGTSHWDKFAPGGALPGAKPQFFFAPAQVVKRREEWGGSVVQRKISDAWQRLAHDSASWLTVAHTFGLEDALTIWRDLAAGRQRPDVGHVVVID